MPDSLGPHWLWVGNWDMEEVVPSQHISGIPERAQEWCTTLELFGQAWTTSLSFQESDAFSQWLRNDSDAALDLKWRKMPRRCYNSSTNRKLMLQC